MEHQQPHLPKWADRFLVWFCADELLEEIQGDLHESFARNVREMGVKAARKQFILEVLRFFRPAHMNLMSRLSPKKIHLTMITNNFRFILRRLSRQKLNTGLHLTGLSIGLAVCLLIGLFIHHELSFDRYHAKLDRIYRVNQVWDTKGERQLDFGAPAPLANALRAEFPSIEAVGVAYPLGERIIEVNPQKRFKQSRILMADAGLLDILDFELIRGQGQEALLQPNQALLTESTAEKFFGSEDPLGKTFLYQNEHTVTVAGIIADLPGNTHLPATVLLSYFPNSSFMENNQDNWGLTFGASTYVLLKEGVDPQSLHAPIRALYDRNINEKWDNIEIGYAELQPLASIHLEPEIRGGGEWIKAINPVWLWFFGAIGLLVLLLACINFVNLSTAQALTRAREVGIRKAIGADRRQLMGQFLGEAFLLIVVSSVLALAVSQVALPYINELTDKLIDPGILFSVYGLAAFLSFIVLTGLFTGAYPAWLIARFQPATAIKTSFQSREKRSSFLRKGLVVTQFTISAALLIALLIMSQQMDYFHHKNLGFEQANIVNVRMPDVSKNAVFKETITALPQVENISFAMSAPAGEDMWGTYMHETDLNDPQRKNVRIIWADEQYDDLYGLQLLAGRYIENSDTSAVSENIPAAERVPKVIVNQRLVQEMGLGTPEEALHQRFLIGFDNWQPEIVGVVADFNISSLHEQISPLLISPMPRWQREASIKLRPGEELPATLAAIQATWEKLFPDGIYEFHFLEQTIERYYTTESRLYGLFKIFAGLAMLISCLGLWGLVTFATAQRKKEIGIRKVFGASVAGLVRLLSRDFLLLVVIALVVAVPISWIGMQRWLENFAFRIDIHWPVFVLSALLVLAIAFLTVSLQSIRAALDNPASSLQGDEQR